MRISDWSSDVCSSDLGFGRVVIRPAIEHRRPRHRGAVRVHQKTLTTLTSEIPENIEERRHLEEVAERALHRVEPDHDQTDPQHLATARAPLRSDTRRVGTDGVLTRKSRWPPCQ